MPRCGALSLLQSCYNIRGAARCLLYVLGRSAKTDAYGRSFAVLSTRVSTVGFRLRHTTQAGGWQHA
jgi:hypothetical protein